MNTQLIHRCMSYKRFIMGRLVSDSIPGHSLRTRESRKMGVGVGLRAIGALERTGLDE